jgi:hypothetical protein
MLRLPTEMHVIGEEEVVWPVDDLFVRVPWVFGAEWCITNLVKGYISTDGVRKKRFRLTRHSYMMAPNDHQSHSFP